MLLLQNRASLGREGRAFNRKHKVPGRHMVTLYRPQGEVAQTLGWNDERLSLDPTG